MFVVIFNTSNVFYENTELSFSSCIFTARLHFKETLLSLTACSTTNEKKQENDLENNVRSLENASYFASFYISKTMKGVVCVTLKPLNIRIFEKPAFHSEP